jgi:hypothetical protein
VVVHGWVAAQLEELPHGCVRGIGLRNIRELPSRQFHRHQGIGVDVGVDGGLLRFLRLHHVGRSLRLRGDLVGHRRVSLLTATRGTEDDRSQGALQEE